MPWTDEKKDRLVELWEAGRTAGEIAAEMPEFSRNAIIGQAHRLGLSARPSPIICRRPLPSTPKSRECEYPIGEPGKPGFKFCHKRVQPGYPYCPEHKARCYRKWERTEDAA